MLLEVLCARKCYIGGNLEPLWHPASKFCPPRCCRKGREVLQNAVIVDVHWSVVMQRVTKTAAALALAKRQRKEEDGLKQDSQHERGQRVAEHRGELCQGKTVARPPHYSCVPATFQVQGLSSVATRTQEALTVCAVRVQSLHQMMDLYYEPLRQMQYKLHPILSENDINAIFGNARACDMWGGSGISPC
eukprot:2048808-Rhodomonas_salina.1